MNASQVYVLPLSLRSAYKAASWSLLSIVPNIVLLPHVTQWLVELNIECLSAKYFAYSS